MDREQTWERLLTLLTGLGLLVGLVSSWTSAPVAASAGGFALAYLAGGLPLGVSVSRSLFSRQITIDLLMLLAALAAAAVGEVRDGAILLFLFSLANTLEDYALGRTRRAVESLMDLRPETALRQASAGLEVVPVESLAIGDTLLIRPGERIPADGTIVVGRSAIDESMLTGESMPVDKAPQSAVFAGTLNGYGALEVQVSKLAQESTLARMISLVTEAQSKPSSGQRFGDWFGQRYTVAVLAGTAVALITFLALGLSWNDAFYKMATLLVVASPCAVVISIPAATLAALANAARRGVLFKGGAALEDLAKVTILAMDKTGTLTEGRPRVTDVLALDGDEAGLLRVAAGLERASEHPIARSILDEAQHRGIHAPVFTAARTVPGQGMVAEEGARGLWAGTRKLALAQGVELVRDAEQMLQRFERQGKSVILVGDSELRGFITVADSVRPQALGLIHSLGKVGVTRFVMLTGDHEAAAEHVAGRLGLSRGDVHAGLLPEDKLDWIRRLSKEGVTAFVGDGVNDAAALASADVGIAMGGVGSDVALETADIVLLADDLARLESAFQLSNATGKVVRQNLIFAVGAMVVLVSISLFGSLPLPLAVIGHEGGTLLVVANGLRLLGHRSRPAPSAGDRDRPAEVVGATD